MIGGERPLVPEILDQRPRWCEIIDFHSIFARSASAVTPVWKLSRKVVRHSLA